MDKFLLKNNNDLSKAITYFGLEWEKDIKEQISEYPCMLIGFYAEDIEFGNIYRFSSVIKSDFHL